MVQILIYYPYFDGTSTSLIDTYLNLKQYNIDVECYVTIDPKEIKRNLEYIQTLKKSVPKEFIYKTIPLDEAWNKQYENLIMSFGVFRFVENLPQNYKHLFLLDAGRMAYDFLVGDCKDINYVKMLKNTTIYGNEINKNFFNDVNFKVWYHKFSKQRFNHLKQLETKNQILTEDKREKTGNIGFKYLLSNELHYNRYQRWNYPNKKGMCFENIGKMIFEFSALNKKVIYSPLNKDFSDGLEKYLSLFGIDDTKEQQINITEKQLFEVLGMHEDDVLLNDIKENEI